MKKLGMLFFTLCLFLNTIGPLFAETEKESEKRLETKTSEQEDEEVELEIKLEQSKYELEIHSSYTIAYEVSDDVDVEFQVEKPDIVSIDKKGMITAKKAGTSEIILKAEKDGKIATASIFVTVFEPETPGQVFFKQKTFYLIRDLSYQIPYELKGDVDPSDLVWRSSNPQVASVENGIVYGHRIGKTVIEASAPDNTAKMEIHVTAPLKGLAFNVDEISLTLNKKIDLPELVYIPYDTTSSRKASYHVEKPDVIALEKGQIVGKSIGKSKVFAKINDIEAVLEVEVKAPTTASGANILELSVENDGKGPIKLVHPELSFFDANRFVLKWPEEEIVKLIKASSGLDLYLYLDAKLYDENVLERFILPKEIMQEVSDKNPFNLHLYDLRDKHYLSYHFQSPYQEPIDLNFSFGEVSDVDKGQFSLPDGSYHLHFSQSKGFPTYTEVSIPQKMFASDQGFYFIYLKDDRELIDTETSVELGEDAIRLAIEGGDYILTPTKLSSLNDKKIIWALSLSFLAVVAFAFYRYYSMHR